jgi:predicted Fe-Mo cluster-binding NifX family protein
MSEERTIAIASEDTRGFEGQVSAHFGRCPYYVLAEVDGTVATVSRVVPNPFSGAHRPGVMPRFIHDLGADVIIAGGMGPRAIDMFHGFGIAVATGAIGTVEDVLGAYVRGEHREEESCVGPHRYGCGEQERQTGR